MHQGTKLSLDCGSSFLSLTRVEISLKHEVTDMDRTLEFTDGALRILFGLLKMFFNHRKALDSCAHFSGQNFENLTGLTLLGTGYNSDLVTAFDMELLHVREPPELGK